MPRGPLPDPHAQRRNAPTIPTTVLPAEGRDGPVPDVPAWVRLGTDGRAWWEWAWRTPEAAGWSSSLVDIVAQRAALVDDLNALDAVHGLDFDELAEAEGIGEIRRIVQSVARLATGKTAVLSAMNSIDQQLGFGAKNLAALRWTIKGGKRTVEEAPEPSRGGARDRLRVVGRGA